MTEITKENTETENKINKDAIVGCILEITKQDAYFEKVFACALDSETYDNVMSKLDGSGETMELLNNSKGIIEWSLDNKSTGIDILEDLINNINSELFAKFHHMRKIKETAFTDIQKLPEASGSTKKQLVLSPFEQNMFTKMRNKVTGQNFKYMSKKELQQNFKNTIGELVNEEPFCQLINFYNPSYSFEEDDSVQIRAIISSMIAGNIYMLFSRLYSNAREARLIDSLSEQLESFDKNDQQYIELFLHIQEIVKGSVTVAMKPIKRTYLNQLKNIELQKSSENQISDCSSEESATMPTHSPLSEKVADAQKRKFGTEERGSDNKVVNSEPDCAVTPVAKRARRNNVGHVTPDRNIAIDPRYQPANHVDPRYQPTNCWYMPYIQGNVNNAQYYSVTPVPEYARYNSMGSAIPDRNIAIDPRYQPINHVDPRYQPANHVYPRYQPANRVDPRYQPTNYWYMPYIQGNVNNAQYYSVTPAPEYARYNSMGSAIPDRNIAIDPRYQPTNSLYMPVAQGNVNNMPPMAVPINNFEMSSSLPVPESNVDNIRQNANNKSVRPLNDYKH